MLLNLDEEEFHHYEMNEAKSVLDKTVRRSNRVLNAKHSASELYY